MTGLKLFYFVLVGQALSMFGSTLTNFGLGVWAYGIAGNVSDFTYISIASTLPGIVLGPFVGILIDRWPRKAILFTAQLGCALVTLTMAILYWQDKLQLWHIIALTPLSSVCLTMLQVGFTASISLVVPKQSLTRANGALGLTFGSIQLAGPLAAGISLDTIGLEGVFVIDVITFGIGLMTLAIVKLPNPEKQEEQEPFEIKHLWHDLVDAYRYMKSKKGVLGGLYLFTLIWFNVAIVHMLFVPLVLTMGTKTDLGFVQSMGGVGVLAGGILMVIWKGPERKMLAILTSAAFMAIGLMILPLFTSITALAIGAMLIMLMAPITNTSSQTLWQKKTDPVYQGRVFSLRNTIMKAAQPLAYFCAGFLADKVFEPLMVEGALLHQYFGPYFGAGEGRGVALFMSLVGFVSLIYILITWCVPSVRRADIDIPDYDEEVEKTAPDKAMDPA